MNDITGVINYESEISHINITRVRACEPVSYPDLNRFSVCTHVKSVCVLFSKVSYVNWL